MNNRIKDLMEKAGIHENQYTTEKFAELIIGECIKIADNHYDTKSAIHDIKKHFGIETEYNMNRIMLNKKKPLSLDYGSYKQIYTDMTEIYLVPFSYDDNGYKNLHEPNHNLSENELSFKYNIREKIMRVLVDKGWKLGNINFNSMTLIILK